MSAAEEIRQSIAALHPELRTRWERGDSHIVTVPSLHFVANAHSDDDDPDECHAKAAHIALLASPDVAEALAEHIDASHALEAFDDEEHQDPLIEWADRKARWRATLRALEQALTVRRSA